MIGFRLVLMIGRVIPILAFLTATPAPHAAQASAAPAGHCVGAEYRQFDFWVGSWDVYPTGQSQLVAHSLIESVYNGCRWIRPSGRRSVAGQWKELAAGL